MYTELMIFGTFSTVISKKRLQNKGKKSEKDNRNEEQYEAAVIQKMSKNDSAVR